MSLMHPFSSIREDLNRIFNEMDQEFVAPLRMRGQGERSLELPAMWTPAIDIMDEGDHLKVKVAVPGLKSENIQLEVENSLLTIQGETERREEESKKNYFRREIMQGRLYRRINLPCDVQADKAEASFEHGVLTVRLPKSEESRRHRIKIRG